MSIACPTQAVVFKRRYYVVSSSYGQLEKNVFKKKKKKSKKKLIKFKSLNVHISMFVIWQCLSQGIKKPWLGWGQFCLFCPCDFSANPRTATTTTTITPTTGKTALNDVIVFNKWTETTVFFPHVFVYVLFQLWVLDHCHPELDYGQPSVNGFGSCQVVTHDKYIHVTHTHAVPVPQLGNIGGPWNHFLFASKNHTGNTDWWFSTCFIFHFLGDVFKISIWYFPTGFIFELIIVVH